MTTCECACHLNQESASERRHSTASANPPRETGSGQLVSLARQADEVDGAQAAEFGGQPNVMNSQNNGETKSAAIGSDRRQTLAERNSSQIYAELDLNQKRQQQSGEALNNSETNLRRRQSNLNSSSSCSRCNARRNRFQMESQSNSLCSSSLQHEEEEEEDDEDEEEEDNQNLVLNSLAKTKADFSSLSSANCNQHDGVCLHSMETNSLDEARKLAAKRDQLGDQLHRKSLGGGQCECCACAVCCRGSAEATDEAPASDAAATAAAGVAGSGGGVILLVAHQPEVERTIEVVLDGGGGGGGTKAIVSSLAGGSTRLLNSGGGGGGLDRAHGSGAPKRLVRPAAAWWRCLVDWLTPAESTRHLIAICWRRLQLIRTKQSSRLNHCRPPAPPTAPEIQSSVRTAAALPTATATTHQVVANHLGGDLESKRRQSAGLAAVCPNCQCPASVCAELPVVQLEANSVAAAVASSTTQVALTAAESLVLRSKTFTNSSGNQRVKVQLIEQQQQQQQQQPSLSTVQSQAAQMEGVESKRERKAAKTLAIITGVFVMCWLPFFVMAIAMPLLELKPHKFVFPLFLWLGYFNSMLNPIIYTIFSPDFRKAFKRLLCGQKAAQAGADHWRKRPNSSCHSNGNAANSSRPEAGSPGEQPRGYLAVVCHRLGGVCLAPVAACCCGPSRGGSEPPSDRFNPMGGEPISTPNSSPRIIPGHQQHSASVTNLLSGESKPTRSLATNHF